MFSCYSTRCRRRGEIFDCSPLKYFLWFHTISNVSYSKTLLSEVSFNTLLLWLIWHSIIFIIYQSVMASLSNIKWASLWENLFIPYANNKGADQPAHPRSLISAFVVRCLDSIIHILAKSKISTLKLSRPVWVQSQSCCIIKYQTALEKKWWPNKQFCGLY